MTTGRIAAALIAAALSSGAQAQTLSTVHVGDDRTALAALPGAPAATETANGATLSKWIFANGNTLSVVTSEAGKVVYLESDWGGRVDGAGSDFPGLRFGETTLQDLRAKFRNNGMAFRGRAPIFRVDDGVVMLNSYGTGDAIVTFITKVGNAEMAAIKPAETQTVLPARAKLDAISLASPEYAARQWGEPVYDPNYRQIEWK